MLLETQKEQNRQLDDDILDNMSEHPSEITEAAELLHRIMNASYACSGDCLETIIHDARKSIRTLYWECKRLIDQVNKGGEKTAFLTMSVLEDTFSKVYPLLLVNVKDIVENNGTIIEDTRRLMELIKCNPYKKEWEEKAESYRSLLEKLGFYVSTEDYRDLTAIMDPLLDAFSTYTGKGYRSSPTIYKVRTGKTSKTRPQIALSVCKFSSEKEFVDTVAQSKKESIIAFGAIEKTNRQISDRFHQWYYGYPEERQRNTIRNEKLTTEEYMSQVANYSRGIYLCVKSAETIWLMRMPHLEAYPNYEEPASQYHYGSRSSYAPYQIFFKDLPSANPDTTFLTVHRPGYKLAELMDDMQKIWLPVFMEETYQRFFLSEPESTEWILPEEMAAVLPADMVTGKTYSIIPMASELPAKQSFIYHAKSAIEEFADEPHMLALFRFFHISSKDIEDVPVLPVNACTAENAAQKIQSSIRSAYLKVLAEKVMDYLPEKWNVWDMLQEYISSNREVIIERALQGEFDAFSTLVVDGAPILDENGLPVMEKEERWPYKEKPALVRTYMEDCQNNHYTVTFIRKRIFWNGPKTAGKPPVVLKIRPSIAGNYAALLNVSVDELPELLKFSDAFQYFYETYSDSLPDALTNRYIANSHRDDMENNKTIFLPRLADINICMSKRSAKSYKSR